MGRSSLPRGVRRQRKAVGRRGVLLGAAALGMGTAVELPAGTSAGATAGTTYARHDVWSLGAPWNAYTEAYARAVRVMQARPSADPTSWYYQAAMHGTFVRPVQPLWNQCQHQSWHFFPWHRMFLYYFERIVRAAVLQVGGPADWALPYWNYDRPFPSNTLPESFRVPTLPDGSANPLYLPDRRSPTIMAGFQLNPRITSPAAAMATTKFADVDFRNSFGGGPRPPAQFAGNLGALEKTPHNNIHNLVGGEAGKQCQGNWMSDVKCAGNDPIFWLHHANIDRLWDVWLAQGGGRTNPPDDAWRNQPFTFYDETGAPASLTAAGVLDAASQLGYVYA